VICWGDEFYGQDAPPNEVNGNSGTATAIALGDWHSCAIQAGTGYVVCWGEDSFGQATPPNEVNGVSGTALSISTGANHTCAIQADTGICVCWGNDGSGQATPPDKANGVLGTATDVAAGGFHTLAIVELPEPPALLAQFAGLALLGALHRTRTRKRRGQTGPISTPD
jgi:mannose/fructose/N-acetylgalactosamine-specific phosphotransferase system component IIC